MAFRKLVEPRETLYIDEFVTEIDGMLHASSHCNSPDNPSSSKLVDEHAMPAFWLSCDMYSNIIHGDTYLKKVFNLGGKH